MTIFIALILFLLEPCFRKSELRRSSQLCYSKLHLPAFPQRQLRRSHGSSGVKSQPGLILLPSLPISSEHPQAPAGFSQGQNRVDGVCESSRESLSELEISYFLFFPIFPLFPIFSPCLLTKGGISEEKGNQKKI